MKSHIYAPLSLYAPAITRSLLISAPNTSQEWLNAQIYQAKCMTNITINTLSLLLNDRILPYISIAPHNRTEYLTSNQFRIFFRDACASTAQTLLDDKPDITADCSYIIEYLSTPQHHSIIAGSNEIFDAKLVFDSSLLSIAISDIMLDTCMFNSYPELTAFSLHEKQLFSQNKYKFCEENNEKKSPYTFKENENIRYSSIAFIARTGKSTLHVKNYIELWEKFMIQYYPNIAPAFPALQRQLYNHKQIGSLPLKEILNESLRFKPGGYMLIRPEHINAIKHLTEFQTLFGTENITMKEWKILPIDEYPHYKKYLHTSQLSAYKIIIPVGQTD